MESAPGQALLSGLRQPIADGRLSKSLDKPLDFLPVAKRQNPLHEKRFVLADIQPRKIIFLEKKL